MLEGILLGAAMALVIEGLVLALAPSRLEDMLKVITDLPIETRRMIGLGCVAAGVGAVAVITALF